MFTCSEAFFGCCSMLLHFNIPSYIPVHRTLWLAGLAFFQSQNVASLGSEYQVLNYYQQLLQKRLPPIPHWKCWRLLQYPIPRRQKSMKTVLKVPKLKLSRHFSQTVAEDVIVSLISRRAILLDHSFDACEEIMVLVFFDPEGHMLEGK